MLGLQVLDPARPELDPGSNPRKCQSYFYKAVNGSGNEIASGIMALYILFTFYRLKRDIV